MDRRIARTRRLLGQALVELVNEERYETITIRDITDRADIGYATFFRHYDTKDALMLDVMTDLVSELEALQVPHSEDYFQQEGRHFFQHFAANAALYRNILDSASFARKLRDQMAAIVMGHLTRHAHKIVNPHIPVEIAAQHIVSSVLGLIDWWLRQRQPYTVDQMAAFYARLVIEGTWFVLKQA